jgi:peptidyl-prolyl cis-trans isomerase C
MKMFRPCIALVGLLLPASLGALAADSTNRPPPPVAPVITNLFPDKTVARAKGFEIKQSQVDDAFTAYKATLAARRQTLPESDRATVESNLIDRLVVVRILTDKATDAEKTKAKERADRILKQYREGTLSNTEFDRQLLAMGLNAAQFQQRILEQAICEEVIERDVGVKVSVSTEQAKQFYDDNPRRFEEPEKVKVSHVLISRRNELTGRDLTEEEQRAKRALAEQVLQKVKAGADFTALVKEFSDDIASKERNGEYTFARGGMPPEFDAAAFSMKTNQISDVVTTRFGYHIIKLLERIPPRQMPFAEVEKRIVDELRFREIQKLLPDYLAQVKKAGGVEILKDFKSN